MHEYVGEQQPYYKHWHGSKFVGLTFIAGSHVSSFKLSIQKNIKDIDKHFSVKNSTV